MSVQKVVDKNTSAVGNNVVYDGQYSSSVFSRTLEVSGANDALAADIVLGETSWTAALAAADADTQQVLTLSVKDAVGGTAVQVTDDAWAKGPNWTNATHKVVCQISSTIDGGDPAFGTDVGCITGGINTSGGAVEILLTRNPTGATGGVAPNDAKLGTASVVISVVKRNIATGTGGFS